MAYPGAGGQGTLLTGNLSHPVDKYYKREALDQLWKKFRFAEPCMKDSLPQRNGVVIQWFRYGNMATNTTARVLGAAGGGGVTEGTIGTGTTLTSAPITATASQYADYIALSDVVIATYPDDTVTAASKNLGYRAGLSADTIVRTEIDGGSAAAMTVQGTYFRGVDAAAAAKTLQANDVEALANGNFYGIMHPYTEYDFLFDPQAGGFFDLQKYTDKGAIENSNGDMIGTFGGVTFYRSTNVKIVTTDVPDTYYTYVFGKNGVGIVDLEGKGPSKVVDPKKQAFGVKVKKFNGDIDRSDPEGVIGAIVSYNFLFVAKILQTAPYRYRMFGHAVSLVTT